MMKPTFLAASLALGLVSVANPAFAAGEAVAPLEKEWKHEGVFGTFDRGSAQRGFQVYREICASCHALSYMSFRTLADIGYDEDQIKAIAAEYSVVDGPDDDGEMFEREGRPSDYVPSPYPNDNAARASNGGAYPPDLSLITKARVNGVNYVYSLLQGYDEAHAEDCGDAYYNTYFPGHCYGMPQPLWGDDVEYADGTEASIEQQSADVAQFLHWVAEPKLEERKQTGLKVMLFLVIMTAITFAYKRKIWADLH